MTPVKRNRSSKRPCAQWNILNFILTPRRPLRLLFYNSFIYFLAKVTNNIWRWPISWILYPIVRKTEQKWRLGWESVNKNRLANKRTKLYNLSQSKVHFDILLKTKWVREDLKLGGYVKSLYIFQRYRLRLDPFGPNFSLRGYGFLPIAYNRLFDGHWTMFQDGQSTI